MLSPSDHFVITVHETLPTLPIDAPKDGAMCVGEGGALKPGETKEYTCLTPVIGRYVVVQNAGTSSRYLAICEFQVYGGKAPTCHYNT